MKTAKENPFFRDLGDPSRPNVGTSTFARWNAQTGELTLAQQNGAGLKALHFNLSETEALVGALLKALPFVDQRTELAWDLRHRPRFRLIRGWDAVVQDDQPTIRRGRWYYEVTICNVLVHRSRALVSEQEDALVLARAYLADSIAEPHEVIEDDPIARAVAERRAMELYIEHLCKKLGVSEAELMQRLAAGVAESEPSND